MSRHAQARLSNQRHEVFAQARAGGATLSEAYEAAGFKKSTQHASRLASRPEVAARISFLQAGNTASTAKAIAAMDTGPSLAELGVNAASIAWMYRCVAENARQYATLESTSHGNGKRALEAAVHSLGKISELMRMEEKMATSNAKSLPTEPDSPILDVDRISDSIEKIIQASKNPEPVE